MCAGGSADQWGTGAARCNLELGRHPRVALVPDRQNLSEDPKS